MTSGADRAPNFSSGYPGNGERLGPGWQRVWDHLADGKWHSTLDIFERSGSGLAKTTITGLMGQALMRDLVSREYSKRADAAGVARKRAYYRRNDRNA